MLPVAQTNPLSSGNARGECVCLAPWCSSRRGSITGRDDAPRARMRHGPPGRLQEEDDEEETSAAMPLSSASMFSRVWKCRRRGSREQFRGRPLDQRHWPVPSIAAMHTLTRTSPRTCLHDFHFSSTGTAVPSFEGELVCSVGMFSRT